MLKTLQARKTGVRIVLGAVLIIISAAMVITLGVGPVGTMGSSPDTLATVAGSDITINDVNLKLDHLSQGQAVPPVLRGIYAQQILNQLMFDRMLEYEAKRLGIVVTPQEMTERIKLMLPTVFSGDTWLKDRYANEVQLRTGGWSVEEFEDYVRTSLLQEKFEQLVTAGVTASPEELQQEFRRKNEKVKLDYVEIKPAALASSINPADAELAAYFTKNASRYSVPEKRSARYALLDLIQLRQKSGVSDAELRANYDENLDRYRVPDRVHAEQILFKTIGKTDAEIAEIRKQAEDVLQKAKHGGNFEDLAKKNSTDDLTKAKGGDLGWIVRGQTAPQFEKAAFSLGPGAVSDLIQTDFGFVIVKVLEKETAHTKSFEEERPSILSTLQDEKVDALANKIADEMAAVVRRSSSQSLDLFLKTLGSQDALAAQALTIADAPLASANDPVGELGNSKELHDALFSLREGELSLPLRLDRGYVVLSVKQILATHPGTLAEVRDKVLDDFRREKSVELARTRAEELARRVKAGEDFTKAAKALSLDVKTSDLFARDGTVGDLGSARQLDAAFNMTVGQTSDAVSLQANWTVFRIAAKEEPNQDDFSKQRADLEQKVLQDKRSAAYDAFRTALEDRLIQEGKVIRNLQNLKKLSSPT